MALQFLQDDYQDRFTLQACRQRQAGLQAIARSRDQRGGGVPRLDGDVDHRVPGAQDRHDDPHADGRQPAGAGRFWIDPSNGSVLISEMIVDGGGVIATVTVSYQSEPLMGFLVPVEMRESYLRYGERITGHAEYGKFRPIEKQ